MLRRTTTLGMRLCGKVTFQRVQRTCKRRGSLIPTSFKGDFGIGFYNREQFRAAIQNSDCAGVTSYGNKIISAAPDDVEVRKAISNCVLQQSRQQMRAALQKSDCGTALSVANKMLALEPNEDEALKAVKQCSFAITHSH